MCTSQYLVIVGDKNCGGAAAGLKAVTAPPLSPNQVIVKACVRTQVENFAVSVPVKGTWVGGRENW